MVEKTILPCGLTVISEENRHLPSLALAYTLKSGARAEELETAGIHHLIEHMIFKGCDSYNVKQIAEISDRLGGTLNAFTAKELTQYYLKAVNTSFDTAFDLLSRIVFKSTFPADEFEREKNVILQEIKEGEDNPDTFAYENFFEQAFPENGLGFPIGGKKRWVSRLTRDRVFQTYQTLYSPENLVLSAAGNVTHSVLVEHAARFFAAFPSKPSRPFAFPRAAFQPGTGQRTNRSLKQYYVILGFRGISQPSPLRQRFLLLNDILGAGMSSRLFQKIREEKGLAYSISSFLESFVEEGILVVFAAVEARKIDEYLEAVRNEIDILRKNRISQEELEKAKDHLLAAVVLSLETHSARMRFHTSNEIYMGREQTLEEIIREIRDTTVDDIAELANEYLDLSKSSLHVYGNIPGGRSFAR